MRCILCSVDLTQILFAHYYIYIGKQVWGDLLAIGNFYVTASSRNRKHSQARNKSVSIICGKVGCFCLSVPYFEKVGENIVFEDIRINILMQFNGYGGLVIK